MLYNINYLVDGRRVQVVQWAARVNGSLWQVLRPRGTQYLNRG